MMQTIASLFFLLIQLIVTPFYALFVLLCAPLPAAPRYSAIMGWTWFFTWLADKLCGVRFEVIGKENIPLDQSLIVTAKHSSTWETLSLAYMFRPASFIAKRELLWIPFFGWGFALSSPITINRSAGSQAMAQMVTQGTRRVRNGFNIIIFPEGTRIKAGKAGKYKTGCARLAIGLSEAGANTLILPIAHNAGYCWPKGTFMKTRGNVTLSILPAIDPTGREAGELTLELERLIEAETARLGDPRGKA
jgi:1-acyl-sn-glycerol-3-phosphate acyltransferase